MDDKMKKLMILCVFAAVWTTAATIFAPISATAQTQHPTAGQVVDRVIELISGEKIVPVKVDGTFWAPVNVAEKGTFVKNAYDFGGYYNQVEARTACPDGWRLPSGAEMLKLMGKKNEWVIMKGVLGRRFTIDPAAGTTIFLPAAGYKAASGEVAQSTEQGWYWAFSTVVGSKYFLDFYETYMNKSGTSVLPDEGISVRCVLDE